jgi:hypothetical protein
MPSTSRISFLVITGRRLGSPDLAFTRPANGILLLERVTGALPLPHRVGVCQPRTCEAHCRSHTHHTSTQRRQPALSKASAALVRWSPKASDGARTPGRGGYALAASSAFAHLLGQGLRWLSVLTRRRPQLGPLAGATALAGILRWSAARKCFNGVAA